jgi:AraC-like DNA-binding protein
MLGDGWGAAEASVGYASPSHFNRDFKEYFGASPHAYVKRFRAS